MSNGNTCTTSPAPGDDIGCRWPGWTTRCEYWKFCMGNQEWHALACGIQWATCNAQHQKGPCLWLQFKWTWHKRMLLPGCTKPYCKRDAGEDCTNELTVHAWPEWLWPWIVFIPQVTLYVLRMCNMEGFAIVLMWYCYPCKSWLNL